MAKNTFADMKVLNPERLRELAHEGGLAAQQKGRAHKFTDEERKQGGLARAKQGTPKRKPAETLDLFPEPMKQTLLFPDDEP